MPTVSTKNWEPLLRAEVAPNFPAARESQGDAQPAVGRTLWVDGARIPGLGVDEELPRRGRLRDPSGDRIASATSTARRPETMRTLLLRIRRPTLSQGLRQASQAFVGRQSADRGRTSVGDGSRGSPHDGAPFAGIVPSQRWPRERLLVAIVLCRGGVPILWTALSNRLRMTDSGSMKIPDHRTCRLAHAKQENALSS